MYAVCAVCNMALDWIASKAELYVSDVMKLKCDLNIILLDLILAPLHNVFIVPGSLPGWWSTLPLLFSTKPPPRTNYFKTRMKNEICHFFDNIIHCLVF